MVFLTAKNLKLITIISVVSGLTACVNPVKKQHDAIVGNWKIVDIQGQEIISDQAKLTFSKQGNVSGNNGCNNIKGSYSPVHDHLNLSQLASTRKACSGKAEQHEVAFNQALSKIEHFLVKGKSLFLTDEQDKNVISLQKR